MIEVFLVDDEQKALDTLSNVLNTFFDSIEVCGTATNVDDAFRGIIKKRPQLVFLDVEMGSESGFQLLEKFDRIDFQVAFVTAHAEYALKAIKFSALDYIIKPAGVSELKELLNKVEEHRQAGYEDKRVENMFGNLTTKEKMEHKITVPMPEGFEFIRVRDIMHIKADSGYSHITLGDNKAITSSKSLKFFENLLDSYGFYRIHYSTVVNFRFIKNYRKTAGGLVTMENGEEFSIARSRKEEFLKLISMH